MRNAIASFILLFASLFSLVHPASAESLTAGNIFAGIGGTTTIDNGGSIHSQSRSIYSFGGGMTSFQGKRVSLLAADPPSFSASCSGISWHFGGFSFISTDEIRQLVEAVAQASLGVVVDLAMQTLCPQCYAVMSKLRDISNQMRNAAADACKVAKHMGAMLKEKMGVTADSAQGKCGEVTASNGKSNGFLNGVAGSLCGGLSAAQGELEEFGKDVLAAFEVKSNKPGVTQDRKLQTVNHTYQALTALGYRNGFVKDVLLSYLGMHITFPVPAEDCRAAFANLYGDAMAVAMVANTGTGTGGTSTNGAVAWRAAAVNAIAESQAQTAGPSDADKKAGVVVKPAADADAPKVSDITASTAPAEPGAATKKEQTCYAPPLLTGIDAIGQRLVCGFNQLADMNRFYTKFGIKLDDSGLGILCNAKFISETAAAGIPTVATPASAEDPLMYRCQEGSHSCLLPQMVRYSAALNGSVHTDYDEYTGLGWMVLDALYDGVRSIQAGTPMEPKTIRILNGSGYPLYRILNIAAVYPGMADQLLQAYGGIIAVHYAMDTLSKLMVPGAMPTIDTNGASALGLPPNEMAQLRADIMNMTRRSKAFTDQMQARLAEKRALVETIMHINKSLQAEVISQGLSGNADLALSIKKQLAPSTIDP